MKFSLLSACAREMRHFSKKYRSIKQDMDEFKLVLAQYPRGRGEKNWNRLHESDSIAVFKTRLGCTSLKRDSFRIVYAYLPTENHIEFIEIYFKGDKEAEDQKRIKDYLTRSP